jgi:hypothetical protein
MPKYFPAHPNFRADGSAVEIVRFDRHPRPIIIADDFSM